MSRLDRLGLEITEINDGSDALAYWRSNAGGTVEAGEMLIIQMQYSIPFIDSKEQTKASIEKDIRKLGRSKLCPQGASGSVSRNAGTVGVPNLLNFSVGSVNLDVQAYTVTWQNDGSTLGFSTISFSAERDITFESDYEFNGTWYNPKSWFSDNIPEQIAGPGTPFKITGGWRDKIKDSFSICCWLE